MIVKMKMGPKGQVVIPKHFRDDLGMRPGEEVIVDYDGKSLSIRKTATNFVQLAEALAKSGKKTKLTAAQLKKMYERGLEERYERILRQ